MRIAATGEFGAVTWEMGPETSEQYRSAIARIKEILGAQVADDFERAFVEQVQGIFTMTALQLKSAICAPDLALIMFSVFTKYIGAACEASRGLLADRERGLEQ